MGNLILLPDDPYGMGFNNGKAVIATSRSIAEMFDKEHKTVLRVISDKLDDGKESDLVAQFCAVNFKESKYKSRGKRYSEFLLTRDGFSFVVMGFTGKQADEFKIKYINRFNEMERILAVRNQVRIETPALTAAIQNAHDPAKHYHYSNEMDMINRIVTGKSAKQMKAESGLPDDSCVRDYMTEEQIRLIQQLQVIDAFLNTTVTDYNERKRALQEYVNNLRIPKLSEAV